MQDISQNIQHNQLLILKNYINQLIIYLFKLSLHIQMLDKKQNKKKKNVSSEDQSSSLEEIFNAKTFGTKKVKIAEPVVKKVEKDKKKTKMEQEVSSGPRKIIIESLNKNKIFADILNQANKEPEFLMMLRNLLSGCNRTLEDKKILFKKKWTQLRNSNCSQTEYLKREQELKKLEVEQVKEIKEDIMSKLGYSSIKGFETKEVIIDNFKEQNHYFNECVIDQVQYQKYRNDQLALLQMLMKESDLVSQEYSNKIIKNTNFTEVNIYEKNKPQQTRENQTEMDQKFNNLDSEQNPQSIQFLFMKQFNNINYAKIFEINGNNFVIQDKDKFFMSKKTTSWLLDSKSDEIYSNQKFQVETFQKYTKMLKNFIDHNLIDKITNKQLEQLLEIATYILNSVHYYQKFKLKCSILHPLDILFVIEKIKNVRNMNR